MEERLTSDLCEQMIDIITLRTIFGNIFLVNYIYYVNIIIIQRMNILYGALL